MNNPNRNLAGTKIKDQYFYLGQVWNGYFWDGMGNLINSLNITSSYALNSINVLSITSSFATSSLSSSYVAASNIDGIVATASYVAPSIINKTILSQQTSSVLTANPNIYNGLFVNYVLTDGVNYRAGQVTVVFTTSSVAMDEASTTDIGSTSGCDFISSISASVIVLSIANSTNSNYTLKYSYNTI